MNNTVRKINTNATWHYIDLEEFEEHVREDERNRIKQIRIQKIEEKRQRKEKEIENKIAILKQRVYGFIFVLGTILLCSSPLAYVEEINGNDWTIALLTIPLGLYMMFSKYRLDKYEYIE